ncbi:MAG: sugar ABC transporter permease [Oscillospiraceae bacterium]|nr:sugar ABC transporter permease [Oscillospiraceae bacterium]MDD4413099.1 sugar ABC transporter permease [Oscillospiraceae bacterium]
MKKNKTAGMRIREIRNGYLFFAPWLIGFFAFTLFPFLYSVYLSFSDVTISPTEGIKSSYVGFKWYIEALTVDPTYTISLFDTLRFIVLSTPMIVVAALLLALLLSGKYKGRTLFRAIFFFPVIIISGPVVAELLNSDAAAVINPENYVIYDFIRSLPEVISAPLLYIFDNIVLILWFSGVQVIMFLAGLQKIGLPIREAASIDGASGWQMFWKIYLPFLKPLILLNTIYTIVLLSGFASNAVNGEIVNKMKLTGRVYGYSSALSWIYFVILAALLGVSFLLLRPGKGKSIE